MKLYEISPGDQVRAFLNYLDLDLIDERCLARAHDIGAWLLQDGWIFSSSHDVHDYYSFGKGGTDGSKLTVHFPGKINAKAPPSSSKQISIKYWKMHPQNAGFAYHVKGINGIKSKDQLMKIIEAVQKQGLENYTSGSIGTTKV